MHFDVFNGDADGIIALIQLRLAAPKEAKLITGIKRDIDLLKQVDSTLADTVTVLDISLEKNSEALINLLKNNVKVFYVDHHRSGNIPQSDNLTALINTDANICTSLLVNEHLNNKYAGWAVAAAFGDNMTQSAIKLANDVGISVEHQENLKLLGIYINYNGYGRSVDDLHFHPADLYELLLEYESPLELLKESNSVFYQLEKAYKEDMAKADSATIIAENAQCKIVCLADEPWARRVSGVFGNELANQSPSKAHAVLTVNGDDTYTVSVRAPLNNKAGADEICIQFPTGGGRTGAAGINKLPEKMLEQFVMTMSQYYETR